MIVGVADDRFPGWAVGLPVRSIEHAIAERESGRLEGQLVAVAGHLTLDPRGTECGEGSTAGPASVVCRRTGLLATSSDPVLGVVGDSDQRQVTWLGRPGPHLHPEFLPGTPLPGIIKAEVVNRRVPIEAVPAVVLGRFDDPRARPCLPGRRHCGFEFVVDRIIWSAGRWRERVVIHDPTIDVVPATTRQPATLLGGADLLGASLILTEALLSVETLSRVDPGVAGEIAGQATGPVWYLRGLVRETGHSPRTAVAWAVLDATTGAVLAVGDTTSSR